MEKYTLRELFDRLKIPIAELGRRAGISEVTAAKIRDGQSARRSSINSLLEVFSQLYGVELTINNVTGIVIKDKLARLEAEKTEESSVSDSGPQKRAYTTAEDIPVDWILCSDFFESHEIKETTYRRWLRDGLGGEKLEFEERPRPGKDDKFRYFTPAQQEQALEILKRHGKLKTPESEESPVADEPAWYLPEQDTPRKPGAAPPDGFTYLSDFCTLHHVPYQAAADLFPRAIHGQPIKVRGRNYPIIGPRGRHDFWVQLHTSPDFVTCDDCPHTLSEDDHL